MMFGFCPFVHLVLSSIRTVCYDQCYIGLSPLTATLQLPGKAMLEPTGQELQGLARGDLVVISTYTLVVA